LSTLPKILSTIFAHVLPLSLYHPHLQTISKLLKVICFWLGIDQLCLNCQIHDLVFDNLPNLAWPFL